MNSLINAATQINFGSALEVSGDIAAKGKIKCKELECDTIKVANPKPTLKELMKLAWKMYYLTFEAATGENGPGLNHIDLTAAPRLYLNYLKTLREEFDV